MKSSSRKRLQRPTNGSNSSATVNLQALWGVGLPSSDFSLQPFHAIDACRNFRLIEGPYNHQRPLAPVAFVAGSSDTAAPATGGPATLP
jgi:hypothetical protein